MTIFAFLTSLSAWWEALPFAKQLFYGIGLLAAFVALLLVILGFIGLEHHDAIDGASDDVDHGGGGIFSVKPLTGFFLAFGWAGGLALDQGWSFPAALAAAIVAGAAVMAIIVTMIRAIYAMRSDGTMRVSEAVGAVGTVYVTLPPSRQSGGQVIVNFSGRQETFGALNTAERAVASGDKVKVVALIDSRTVLVEPLA